MIIEVTYLVCYSYREFAGWWMDDGDASMDEIVVVQCCSQSQHLVLWLPLCFQLTFLPSPSCISLLSVSLYLARELAYVSNHFLPAPRRPPCLLLLPRFPLFPCLFPSCSRVPSQFDWSPDWCSYQSPELSLVRDKWTQRRSSPLSTSPFYLPQSPSFNKFVPVNKPSKMTPSP